MKFLVPKCWIRIRYRRADNNPTLRSFSSLSRVHPTPCFLHHCRPPSWQDRFSSSVPGTGKGCRCCPQRSPLCPCETAWSPPVQTPWPPSEPGRAERPWGETPRWCKTPRSALGSWEPHPRRPSQRSSRREHGGVSCSDAPPPESAGHGWCFATAEWRRRALRNLVEEQDTNQPECRGWIFWWT